VCANCFKTYGSGYGNLRRHRWNYTGKQVKQHPKGEVCLKTGPMTTKGQYSTSPKMTMKLNHGFWPIFLDVNQNPPV
jgi:hypothetical protein